MQEQKTNPWLVAFRILFTVALVACVAFIFHNSLEEGTLSSLRSRQVMELINKVLGKLHLGPLSEHIVRKLAHFAEFALLGFLLMLCLRVYTARFVRHVSWPLFGGMSTALCDETLQYYSAGRSPSVRDVWIDMAGVTAGLVVALLLLLVVRLVMDLYDVRQENRALRAERESYLHEQAREEQTFARLAGQAVQQARQAPAPPPAAAADTTGTLQRRIRQDQARHAAGHVQGGDTP